jgi:hypothetical protein
VKKNVVERIGLVADLDYERGEKIAGVFLLRVLVVKKEKSDVCGPIVADTTDIINYCGALVV